MPPEHLMIFGYPLDWWWTAVVVPIFLGIRWWLSYRERGSQQLIKNQSDTIQQLYEMNAALSAQLNSLRLIETNKPEHIVLSREAVEQIALHIRENFARLDKVRAQQEDHEA
jgi:hypothetical protein